MNRSVYFLIDCSESMRGAGAVAINNVMRNIAEDVVPDIILRKSADADFHVQVFGFSDVNTDKVFEIIPKTGLTDFVSLWRPLPDERFKGGAAAGAAIKFVAEMLDDNEQKFDEIAPVIILISGGDLRCVNPTYEEALKYADKNGVFGNHIRYRRSSRVAIGVNVNEQGKKSLMKFTQLNRVFDDISRYYDASEFIRNNLLADIINPPQFMVSPGLHDYLSSRQEKKYDENETVNMMEDSGAPVNNESILIEKLEELDLKRRQSEAIKIAGYFADLQQEKGTDFICRFGRDREMFPILYAFSEREFTDVVKTMGNVSQDKKNNVFTAYVLFYIISAGKYPQEYWPDGVLNKSEDTLLGVIRSKGKELESKLASDGYGNVGQSIIRIINNYRREKESRYIAAAVGGEECVGIATIYELFWDVFVMKYCNYRPLFWKEKIGEFYNKEYKIRVDEDRACEFKETKEGEKRVEIYAVSYEGKLDKPMHYSCEDCSFVTFYNDNMWLAVSADGVGSCKNSHNGSLLATEKLSDVIVDYLKEKKLLPGDGLGKVVFGKYRAISNEVWSNLMYFLRFELAHEFYEAWEAAVKSSGEFIENEDFDITQYASTLQFAFGCAAFIACGRVGDGRFFVRKKEKFESGYYYGGVLLDDCISGVVQTAVMTVANLKYNPSALQVAFFRPDEVEDIIISSDGADSALGDTVEKVSKFAEKMHKLPFDERCVELSRVARLCSDCNGTQNGSGDDCTLVHICIKDR